MDKFILVSLDKNKKVIKESIDMHTLVSKSFRYKSDISSVCESMDILHEHGYRVIIEAGTPYIHNSTHTLTEGRLSDLYNKFKEKFGGSKDEFEEWYQERMSEKREAGTNTPREDYVSNRQVGGHTTTSSPIKGVGGGSTISTAPRRSRPSLDSNESPDDIKAKSDSVSKARKLLPATKGYIKKMFAQDPEMYRTLMNELIADYEETVGKQFKSLATFESKR